ncbi:unnamed protein product [Phytophthora fragariaefolia]|uniref:Unnamed protein product n=1 Tax=Phytophthora fragariaefolia TaxID=1490495 RepID=A0A9W7DFH8_9STRA|nr:unnamed protein product [Phytophthora fragariaefolia]
MSYITNIKIYTPRHTAVYFQQTIKKCFDSLLNHPMVIWINDLLLFADDIDTYVSKLEEFLDLAAAQSLKLSAKKSSLYQRKGKWCGRIISSDGVKHDSGPISDYARVAARLQQRLDAALSSGKHTKRIAAGISVPLTDYERQAYGQVKNLLATSATLGLLPLLSFAQTPRIVDGWSLLLRLRTMIRSGCHGPAAQTANVSQRYVQGLPAKLNCH